MSWSAKVPKTPASEVPAAIDAAEVDGTGNYALAEVAEQLAAAKLAAHAIFRSGAVGREGEYLVSMSGHANPDHGLPDGYAADTVYVSVQRYKDYTQS